MDNAMKKNSKEKDNEKEASNKRLLIFLAVAVSLLGIGAYLLLTHEPKSVAQKFYEDRKSVQYYQEYRDWNLSGDFNGCLCCDRVSQESR